MRKLTDHLDHLKPQTLLVRCNFDVPLKAGEVGDTTRIEAAIPTLKALLGRRHRLILLAHAGRPQGQFNQNDSLAPVVPVLESLLAQPLYLIPYVPSPNLLDFNLKTPVQLVENLRFWPQEEANDPAFAQALAKSASGYVNEAFANCHRPHSSMVSLPQLFLGRSFAGLSLSTEIDMLNKVSQNPKKPFVVVIGGAKLETKEPLVTALAPKADEILVGGKIAADLIGQPHLPPNADLAELSPSGKDITPEAATRFAQKIMSAQTVIWNGTMGIFEDARYQQGTKIVATAVNQTPAFTLIGGGDTEAALTKLNLEAGIDYISTGGGAMLTYLSTGNLIGLAALN